MDSNRVETGPLEFEGDWPGVFIRGDNAMGYLLHLDLLIEAIEKGKPVDPFQAGTLRGIRDLLGGSYAIGQDPPDLQRVKSWKECQR